MAEAQLLLELLVRLLADPTRFHAGYQPALWRPWRQIAQCPSENFMKDYRFFGA